MIRYENATVSYSGHRALADVTAEFGTGITTCLVGASGSGKSTLLRLVNRLVEPTSGRVLLHGEDVARRDPVALRRGIGYSVQGGGLLPHLTVADNVGIVPRLLGWTREAREEAVSRTLALVRLDPARYARRHPSELSGGERQRASIARALAADPEVVLLDEPLGALDAHLRETLQEELRELFRRLRKTVLFVTHDMRVAVRAGERIAVLDGGRLLQHGTPREIVEAPAHDAVLALLGRRRDELARAVEESS
ncbi:MAG: ATP-binding cassette domain-containing protein [Elusimicrobia bacterium]|nr:ATP-binding cassette domain-containing protein [Elusimicrobiota bacterium]